MVREVQSSIVEKLVAVLDLLAHSPGKLSYAEIASGTGFNKSSIHRVLSILQGQALVDFDERDKSYSVGPRLVGWARAAWQKTDVSHIDDQDLINLAEASGMNVAVSVLSEHSVTFIRTQIGKPYKLAVKVGGQSDLHCTAAGKILLAHMPPDELEHYLQTADLEKYTENTLTNRKALLADVRRAKKRGYAVTDREEFWQIVGIAAPILDYERRAVAALSLWIPTKYSTLRALEKQAPCLLEAADNISSRFGLMAADSSSKE